MPPPETFSIETNNSITIFGSVRSSRSGNLCPSVLHCKIMVKDGVVGGWVTHVIKDSQEFNIFYYLIHMLRMSDQFSLDLSRTNAVILSLKFTNMDH